MLVDDPQGCGECTPAPGAPIATGTTTWHYDAVGNRTGEQGTDTNGASTVSRIYSYNARNELTGITDNRTPANSISYTYDANGNQTGKTQGTVQWTYGYDARDELTGISQTDNSGPVW